MGMDFLNDPKNQPKVAAVAAIVILLVGFMYYKMMFSKPGSSSSSDSTTYTEQASVPPSTPPAAAPAPAPAPGAPPPGAPVDPTAAAPGAPATPGAAQPAAGAAPASGKPAPLETGSPDPFKSLAKPKQMVKVVKPPENIPYPTSRIVPRKIRVMADPNAAAAVEQMDQTPRRMAGLVYNGSISAILETGTESVVVKPGDYVENRTMRVEKIEPGRIVLKTVNDSTPRYVVVKMAYATNLASAAGGSSSSYAPSGGSRPGSSVRPVALPD